MVSFVWGSAIASLLMILKSGLALCAVAACFYYLAAMVAVWRWRVEAQHQRALAAFTPPVTILKPLRGAEAEAYDTLASFCRLDYPHYQIVFGVQSPSDDAILIVEALRHDFPKRDIVLVVNEAKHGYNGKVSNLINALPFAKYDVLVIADSDISVPADYLGRVLKPLQEPGVGMVTCLYRGVRAKSFGDLLENLGISSLFAPEVCMARMLQGVKFALGATIALRRDTLDSIGGLAAIADHLADDYELGYAVATKLKQKVVLSECVVDHVANAATLSEMFKHQLRWLRAVRVSRPVGYVGLVVTYGTVTASLAWLASGYSPWTWRLWFVMMSLRMLAAFVAGFIALRDRTLLKWFCLVPLRDGLAFVVWLCGFFGKEIVWRGERLQVLQGGKLAERR